MLLRQVSHTARRGKRQSLKRRMKRYLPLYILLIPPLAYLLILRYYPIIAQVAAISVGVVDGRPMLDLCYQEDSRAQTDMNLVMNQRGEFIELQGTGEGRPFTNRELNRLLDLGRAGVRAMMRAQREALRGCGEWLLPPRRVVVASGNAHKLKELGDIFGGMVELISMKDAGFEGDIEENGTTFEENAVIKAEAVSRATGLPALADDSGLSVDALGGAPGVYSARYAGDHGNDQANNDLLLQNMRGVTNRACRFVCAMALPKQVILIPLLKEMAFLNLHNTLWAVIFPTVGWPFGVFLMKQFYEGVPTELCEAARIDGLSEYGIWWHIMLPLSLPALSTLTIFTFVNTWNDFLGPLIYLTKTELKTIQIGLRMFITQYSAEYGLIMAASVVALIPVLIVFLSLQKYFVQGVASSGLKG